MLKNRKRRVDAAQIVAQAKRHVGYRAQPQRRSAFQLKGYLGQPWNGTFVDRVLHDALGDFAEVRFLSTVTALGYYVKRNGVYQKPKAGDVVFFNFSTDPLQPFEQPHVGIVTEVLSDGSFRTVEGEASSGTPQGSQLADGVFERLRWPAETVGFVRPAVRPFKANGEPSEVLRMSYFDSNGKTVARAVETVQTALNRVRPAFTFTRGKRNAEFKANLGTYARETGTVENRGELTHGTLSTLSDEAGTFKLDT